MGEHEPRHFSPQQLLGLAGAVALILGAFLPLVRLPLLGSITYFRGGKGDGVLVVLLGALGIFAATRERYGWLWVSGGGALAILAVLLLRLEGARGEAAAAVEGTGGLLEGLVERLAGAVELEIGFGVMFVGALLCIASAAIGAPLRKDEVRDALRVLLPVGAVIAVLAVACLGTLYVAHQVTSRKVRQREGEAADLSRHETARATLDLARQNAETRRQKALEDEERRRRHQEQLTAEAERAERERLREEAEALLREEERKERAAEAAEYSRVVEQMKRNRREREERELRERRVAQQSSMRAWRDRYRQVTAPIRAAEATLAAVKAAQDGAAVVAACRNLAREASRLHKNVTIERAPDPLVARYARALVGATLDYASKCQQGKIYETSEAEKNVDAARSNLTAALGTHGLQP